MTRNGSFSNQCNLNKMLAFSLRVLLQGGDSNRRKYFVGWCQFIKMAKAMHGRVIKFPNAIQVGLLGTIHLWAGTVLYWSTWRHTAKTRHFQTIIEHNLPVFVSHSLRRFDSAISVRVQGVEVDAYGYRQSDSHPDFLGLDDALVDINSYDAIAVVPRHKEFLRGVKSIVASNFLEMGNIAGASTTMV